MQMPVAKKSVLVLLATAWSMTTPVVVWGQPPATTDEVSQAEDASTRDEILQSARWQQLRRSFDQWLAVQKLYTEEQVDEFKTELERRISSMSAAELADFMHDMEERLAVLLSDEANDARDYLSYFTEEGIRKRLPGGKIPDVFGMTSSQLRQELQQFEQQRSKRAAANVQLNRQRQRSVDAFVQAQRRRQQAQRQASQKRSAAPQWYTSVKTQYTPRRDPPPKPEFVVSPWGGVWRKLP